MDVCVQNSISKYRCDQVVTGRIDVVSGPTGRRNWPDSVKGRIVAESYSGDVSASEVARREGFGVPLQGPLLEVRQEGLHKIQARANGGPD